MKRNRFLLMMIMLLVGINPVLADTNNNIVDFSKKGNITITLSDSSNTEYVEGANIKISKLATASSLNSNLTFDYQEDLIDCQTDIQNNNLNEDVLNCIHQSSVSTKEGITDSLGYLSFDNLDLGLYLVEQTNTVSGYSQIDPFLVYLPQVENNSWIYQIDATPKIDILRLFDLTVQKIWNVTSGTIIPNEIMIDLYKDGIIIDTIKLNQENNWTYTWNQIEKSDEYSVLEKNIPNGYTATYRKEENKFIVTNTKTLVQTGQNHLISIILTVSGLILIVLGYAYNKKESN